MFRLLIAQSLTLAFRKGGGALGTLAFYIIVVTLFTFALGPDAMKQYGAAVMCVALLLSNIVALPTLFERDHEDGTLEQFLLQPVMLEILVLARLAGQWLAHILPLLVVSPLLGMMASLTPEESMRAMSVLLIASPTLTCIGAIGAALTLGARRGGLLQALIVMPLYIPVLIFASNGGDTALWFLLGLMTAAMPLACFVCSALVRISQD